MSHSFNEFSFLLPELERIISLDSLIVDKEEMIDLYGFLRDSDLKNVFAILRIKNKKQVSDLLPIFSKKKISVFPISTGKNWGYGNFEKTRLPCVFFDLAQLKEISFVDKDLGIVSVGVGVTQEDLFTYLKTNNLPWLTPVTGAHRSCSIVGNLLERGHGISSYVDRIASLVSFEVVLVDGVIYKKPTYFKENNSKWGVGPYLDSIFCQSNFGIITEATILLAPKFEKMEVFSFGFKNKDLGEVFDLLRQLSRNVQNNLAYVTIQNNRKVLTKIIPYSRENSLKDGYIDDEYIKNVSQKKFISDWELMGVIQGSKLSISFVKKTIRSLFKNYIYFFMFFYTLDNALLLERIFLKIQPLQWLSKKIEILRICLKNASGEPIDVSPTLPYWRLVHTYSHNDFINFLNTPRDLYKDGDVGFIFFSSTLLISNTSVISVNKIEFICKKFGFDPLLSLSLLDERFFYLTAPIIYNKKEEKECLNARLCYEELCRIGIEEGFPPNRIHADFMDSVVDKNDPFWQTAEKIKKALDPDNIISPGRYSSYTKEEN